MKPRRILSFVIFLLMLTEISAQLNITDANTEPYNPNNLIRNVFLGSGVEVTGINYEGDERSVGFFSNGIDEINLDRGIVLSTGYVSNINKINETNNDNGDIISGQGIQDPHLAAIANENINDVALYTISFIPSSDTLRFNYVFASEEYPEFICDKNDVFGFFVTGPNPDGGNYEAKNIALIPDPSDPSGMTFTDIPVSINTIHDDGGASCPAEFVEYYNEVPLGTENFQLNAYLDVFIAEVVVVPCEEYTIKLGVADAVDELLNSVVFLQAKSFGTGSLEVELNSLSLDGSLAEGCGGGELEFVLPQIVNEDYIIDIDFYNASNPATPVLDYPEIPSQLIIPAGSNSVSIPLEAYSDGIAEGDEIIAFEIQIDQCNRKKFEITIRDDELFAPILPNDVTICEGDDYIIDSELDPGFILPPSPYFENVTPVDITPEMEAVYSDIQVSGVIPTILTPNLIESVCIKGLYHRDLTDFDVYLISPGGQFLELSTDNGFKTNNFADVDSFINTCFTPFATTNINNGGNLVGAIFSENERYTGAFKPEGEWSDLWDGENPTNGTWRLLVIDDAVGQIGKLDGWSITFRSFYNLTYEWSSIPESALCQNCEDITVSPTEDTEYFLTITDSYGCERSRSMTVGVDPALEIPNLSCNETSQNSIEVIWDPILNANSYELRIDSGAWISTNDLNYTFSDLASSTDFKIEIRSVSDMCNSDLGMLSCRTDDCAQPSVVVTIDQEVQCPEGNDGSVTMTASGESPFVYEINGESNSTGQFNNVPIGTIQYSVMDNLGCTLTGQFEMLGPDSFELNTGYKLSDPCNVVSSITGSINVSGGTPPYEYLWSNLSTDQVAINLSPGTYYFTVTDANDCTISDSLIIPMLEQFRYDVLSSAPLCKDGSNGTASIDIVSGNGPFTYLWEDGTTDSVNMNLSEGFYVVTVTDVFGCEIPQSFTIDEGAILNLSITPVDISCLGMEDGRASVMVSGGIPPYEFVWDGASSNLNMIEGLSKGSHTITVKDANNCEISAMFEIAEPEGMSYEVEKINNVCSDGSSGEIIIKNVSSPNGSVNILWEDGVSTFERTNLINSTYCFTLNDGTTCEINDCVDIESPLPLSVIESIKDPTCVDSEDGEISLSVLGGTGPFNYNWEGPNGLNSSSSQLLDLLPGEYFLTLTDANGCIFSQSYNVIPAEAITTDFTVFPILCYGASTGQIFFSAAGGLPPFTYSWSGPNGFSATTNNIIGVPAGNYVVTYTDKAGCTATFDFYISQPAEALNPNISLPDTICFGTSNGRLEVNPSGGTAPYTIEWNNGGKNEINTSLAQGNYSVTITDARNCKETASSSVTELGEITLTVDDVPSSCFQTNDGSAQIKEVFYGNNSAKLNDFSYQWNTNPTQTNLQASNLIGGQSYTVIATDTYGCRGQETIEVGTPEPIGAEIVSISNVSCFGENDGVLNISGTGGTGNYSYLWDGQTDFSTTNEISQLARGNYKVTVTDENGCIGFNSFAIEEPRPLSMDFRIIDVSCFGGSDGRAEAVVQGGTGPYSINWSNEASGKAIENVVSEQYNVTVTDANGCILYDSTRVNEPNEAIQVTLEVDNVTCNGGNNGKIEINARGGSGFYRYSIDGVQFNASNVYPSLPAGNYNVYVNDFRGCVDTLSEIYIEEPDAIIVDLGPDLIIPYGESTVLNVAVYNHVGAINYKWKSAHTDLLSCINCSDPIFQGDRESSFELSVEDENGCMGSDFITIRLENYSPFFVPTAFTPNGDGENDELMVFTDGIEWINSFQIYDRWGELVYSVKDIELEEEECKWDGVYKGSVLPTGLYYWFAEVTYQNGFKETLNGNTTLLK